MKKIKTFLILLSIVLLSSCVIHDNIQDSDYQYVITLKSGEKIKVWTTNVCDAGLVVYETHTSNYYILSTDAFIKCEYVGLKHRNE
jgi:uncharacterized protein YxeA